ANSSMSENASSDGDLVEELRLLLTPPAYTRRGASVQVDDGNIVALEGTRAEIVIKTGRAGSIAFLSLGGADDVPMSGDGLTGRKASFIVKEDSSYRVTVQAGPDTDSKWEGLYSIKAIKDGPPDVHIIQPASDLLFSSEEIPSSLSIRIRAKDEFEVSSMKLRYIKATGEGDSSQFESGEIRLRAVADAEGAWRGAASLNLEEIGLGPGVSVVLQAEATDNNTLTGPSTGFSESIIIQAAEPEKQKIEVDDLSPNELLRFQTSQRMILIKTERLHRQRGRLSSEEFLARSNEIAVEQRRFRESFNEFSDLEPAHEHEAGEGRAGEEAEPEGHNAALPEIPSGGSQSARSMIKAIRAMWRAEAELRVASTATAIEFEKEALLHLKAAQNGLRYFAQIASKAEPIDLKRRYKGRLDDIRNRVEILRPYSEHPSTRQLNSILSDLYESARSLAGGETLTGQLQAAGRKIEIASEELLQVRGVEVSTLVELSSKLKLLDRLLKGGSIEERQRIIKLLADVCDQIASLLRESGPPGTVPHPPNLNPSSASKAAAYFKLLSTR
ncbi:MAG TPA: hypothetical protein VNO14_12780, partial [Blastocatellia bacterium]|nr:hypothetical protein [Blastocatellia bacterium]